MNIDGHFDIQFENLVVGHIRSLQDLAPQYEAIILHEIERLHFVYQIMEWLLERIQTGVLEEALRISCACRIVFETETSTCFFLLSLGSHGVNNPPWSKIAAPIDLR